MWHREGCGIEREGCVIEREHVPAALIVEREGSGEDEANRERRM